MGWIGEAAAGLFPLVSVVFPVSQHEEDEDFLTGIKNASNQTIFVAADIEHDTVSHNAGGGKGGFYISPGMPLNRIMADMLVPSLEGSLCVFMARKFPEVSEA